MIYLLMILMILAMIVFLVKMWNYYVAHTTDITGWEVKYLEQTGWLAWRYQLRDADGARVACPNSRYAHRPDYWFTVIGTEKRAVRRARLRAAKLQRTWNIEKKRISGRKDVQF